MGLGMREWKFVIRGLSLEAVEAKAKLSTPYLVPI